MPNAQDISAQTEPEPIPAEPSEELAPEPQSDPQEEKARSNGWRPQDEWAGDPDKWVDARTFNERGEFMGKIHELNQKNRELESRLDSSTQEFDKRLANQRKLHEAMMKSRIAELEAHRDNAIEDADKDKVHQYQSQIDEIRGQTVDEPTPSPAQPSPTDNQAILDEWNKNNPWIVDQNSPKAGYAMMRFAFYEQQGLPVKEAIEKMEAEVRQQFPDVNPARETAPTTESGRSRPGNSNPKPNGKLKWADLTQEEQSYFSVGAWTQDEYLQLVADERRANEQR